MKNPSKSTMKNKLDKIFSLVVRKRGYCQRCNMVDYEKFQCCHIYSRANLAVRWTLNNALCLCAGCHFWGHQNPTEFTELVLNILTDYDYADLKIQARLIKKWTVSDMQDLHLNLTKLYEKTYRKEPLTYSDQIRVSKRSKSV